MAHCEYCSEVLNEDLGQEPVVLRDNFGGKIWFCSKDHATSWVYETIDNFDEQKDAINSIHELDWDEVLEYNKEISSDI